MIEPTPEKDEELDEDEKQKAVEYGVSGMADGSSLVISVAVGLLGILALYQFSDLILAGWILLSIGYWLVFLFGLFIFAFHQVNALAVWRYTATMKAYVRYGKHFQNLAKQLWFTRIVIDLTASDDKPDQRLKPKEKLFANLTVVFYFLVALILWLAIAVFTEKYMKMIGLQ